MTPSSEPSRPSAFLRVLDAADRWLARAWNAFRSLKTGLALLSAIGIACIYGTMFYAANQTLGDQAIPLARARVFNAGWFFALLAVFAFQFIVSTWHVTKMSLGLWWKRDFSAGNIFFDRGPGRGVAAPPDGVDGVEARLRPLFTRVHRSGDRFFAHAGLAQRIGPTIIHAGIIVILAAGLVRIVLDRQGKILSEGRFIAEEGETRSEIWHPIHADQQIGMGNIAVTPIPFDIRVLDFDEIMHPNSTSPAYYSTLLEVRDRKTGNVSVAKLDMNHSYRIGRWEFHQAGYQPVPPIQGQRTDFDVWDTVVGERLAVTDASVGTRVQVGDNDLFLEVDGETPGAAWRLYKAADPLTPVASGELMPGAGERRFAFKVVEVFPDFRIGQDGKPFNASQNPDNPALRVSQMRDGLPANETWLFLDPEFAAAMPPTDERFRLNLEDIQVAGDPASIDWEDPAAVRYVISVQDRQTAATVSRQQVFRGAVSEDVKFTDGDPNNPAIGADGPYAVLVRGRSMKYSTILMVVNEPVVPYYVSGVVLMFIGALLTFASRYRAFHGRWDAEAGVLRFALVPRFGKAPDPRDWDRLVTALGGIAPATSDAPATEAEALAGSPA